MGRPAKRAAVEGAAGRGYDETARRRKRERPAGAEGTERKFQRVHIAVARPRAMERLNRLARGDG